MCPDRLLDLTASVSAGLRATSQTETNAPGLLSAAGLVPAGTGLRQSRARTCPLELPEGISWPFPQVLWAGGRCFLCYQTAVYTLNPEIWLLTPLAPEDPDQTGIITGGLWHLAGLERFYVLTNASCSIVGYVDPATNESKPVIHSTPFYNTAAVYKGRVVLGGFAVTQGLTLDYWREKVAELNPTLRERLSLQIDTASWPFLAGNWVFWSSAWSPGMAFLHRRTDEVRGVFEHIDGEKQFSHMPTDIGWMALPYAGDIQVLKPLGDVLVAYSTYGLAFLGSALSPAPTLTLIRSVQGPGVLDRGSVCGDDSGHDFMDTQGDLWHVGPDMSLSRLGYREFFMPAVRQEDHPVSALRDSARGESFFSFAKEGDPLDSDHALDQDRACFVLTASGLGESRQVLTAVFPGLSENAQGWDEGRDMGVFGNLDPHPSSPPLCFTTNIFDMGFRGFKAVRAVIVASRGLIEPTVRLQWRIDGGQFRLTRAYRLSRDGTTRLHAGGVEFRLVLEASAADPHGESLAAIDRISVLWEPMDRRPAAAALGALG